MDRTCHFFREGFQENCQEPVRKILLCGHTVLGKIVGFLAKPAEFLSGNTSQPTKRPTGSVMAKKAEAESCRAGRDA